MKIFYILHFFTFYFIFLYVFQNSFATVRYKDSEVELVLSDYNFQTVSDTSLEQKEENDQNKLEGNHTLINPKVVINPYKDFKRDFIPPKPFGSACLKCEACIAVAKKINQTAYDKLSDDCMKNNVCPDKFSSALDKLCLNGFRKYDLKKTEAHYSITDQSTESEHVPTKMDGSWTKK